MYNITPVGTNSDRAISKTGRANQSRGKRGSRVHGWKRGRAQRAGDDGAMQLHLGAGREARVSSCPSVVPVVVPHARRHVRVYAYAMRPIHTSREGSTIPLSLVAFQGLGRADFIVCVPREEALVHSRQAFFCSCLPFFLRHGLKRVEAETVAFPSSRASVGLHVLHGLQYLPCDLLPAWDAPEPPLAALLNPPRLPPG